MWYAIHMMSIGANNRNSRFYRVNSNTYEIVRKQMSIITRERILKNQKNKAINAINKMNKDEFREKYIKSRPFRKEILCIANSIETIYLSIREASRQLKIERKTIFSSINENREISKGKFIGYRFKYAS